MMFKYLIAAILLTLITSDSVENIADKNANQNMKTQERKDSKYEGLLHQEQSQKNDPSKQTKNSLEDIKFSDTIEPQIKTKQLNVMNILQYDATKHIQTPNNENIHKSVITKTQPNLEIPPKNNSIQGDPKQKQKESIEPQNKKSTIQNPSQSIQQSKQQLNSQQKQKATTTQKNNQTKNDSKQQQLKPKSEINHDQKLKDQEKTSQIQKKQTELTKSTEEKETSHDTKHQQQNKQQNSVTQTDSKTNKNQSFEQPTPQSLQPQQYIPYNFKPGQRFNKDNSNQKAFQSKVKPNQQQLPKQWFSQVNKAKNTTLSNSSTSETPATPVTPTTKNPQTKPSSKSTHSSSQPSKQQNAKKSRTQTSSKDSKTSLRNQQKKKQTFAGQEPKKEHKQNQWQTSKPTISEHQLQNFMVYKNVVLIICSVILVVVLCARIIGCIVNSGESKPIRSQKREEDRQSLKISQSDLLRQPQQPSGNFIEINEDEED